MATKKNQKTSASPPRSKTLKTVKKSDPDAYEPMVYKSDNEDLPPVEVFQFSITDDLPEYAKVEGLDDVEGETTVEVVDHRDKPPRHRKRHPLRFVALSLSLVAIVGIAWTWWSVTEQGSLSHYRVAGVEVLKNSNPEKLKASLVQALKDYRFSISAPGEAPSKFSPSDAGLALDPDKTLAMVQAAQTQSSLFAKLSFWKSSDLPVRLKVDEPVLSAFIKKHLVKTKTEPKNATLSTETGQPIITDDIPGQGITIDKPRETLLDVVSSLEPEGSLKLTAQTIPAKIDTKALKPLESAIEAISATPVEITVNERVFHPSEATIVTWVDPVDAGATTARLEINSGKVAAWIDSITSQFTSPTRNEVKAKNPDGTEKVLTAGKNGSEVLGGDQAARDIVSQLGKKQAVSKTLTIADKSYKVVDVNTYDKWLLADLTNHMLYAYENDQLVRSFPMSAGAPETPTVVGEFKIYSKVRVQTMRGPNADGTSYNVPNVEWISYFTGSYAIHGNYWRPLSTFGSVNTSHGCIGMTNANSQWVYEWAPVGTPVITYN